MTITLFFVSLSLTIIIFIGYTLDKNFNSLDGKIIILSSDIDAVLKIVNDIKTKYGEIKLDTHHMDKLYRDKTKSLESIEKRIAQLQLELESCNKTSKKPKQ